MRQYIVICRHQVLLILATSKLSISEEESKHFEHLQSKSTRIKITEVIVLIYE